MLTTNTGNREILANNSKETVFPEIEKGTEKETIYLQPNSKVKLLEGWTTNEIWLKRNPLVKQYPVATPTVTTAPTTKASSNTTSKGAN